MLPRAVCVATVLALSCLYGSSTRVYAQVGGQFSSPYSPAPPLVPVPNPGSFTAPNPGFSTGTFNPAPGSFLPQNGAVLGGAVQSFDPYALPRGVGGMTGALPPGIPQGPNFAPRSILPPPQQFITPPSNIWSGQVPSFGSPSFGSSLPPTLSPSNVPSNVMIPPNQLPPGANVISPPGLGAPYGQPTGPARAMGATGMDPYSRGGPFGQSGPGGFGNGSNNSGSFGNDRGVFGSAGFGNSGLGNGGAGYGYGNDLGYGNDPGYGYENNGTQPPFQRLFQDTGLRGTYLHGTDNNDLTITEFEASTTAYLANFLGIPNGLRVTPGFTFHWLDGPKFSRTHAPSRLYSAYLDFGLEPQFTPRFGADVSVRVGAYSDFQAFNADSIRILGSGVGVYQVTPQLALKLGAAYIDRVRIKLLPAAGVLWTPNPQTRWDVSFPPLSWQTTGEPSTTERSGGTWAPSTVVDHGRLNVQKILSLGQTIGWISTTSAFT